MIRRFGHHLLLLIAGLFFLIGCHKEAIDDTQPVVYTSFYPIHQLVEEVVGEHAQVLTFMPKEQNAHLWEPSPKDMANLAQADVLFVNGANLEKWVDQVQENLPDLSIVNLSNSVDLIQYHGAAAMGDFQYMTQFQGQADHTYTLNFGHTHENLMRVAMFPAEDRDFDQLVAHGKELMEAKGQVVAQKEHFQVQPGQVYAIEMGHESGQVTFDLPEEGEWMFISDRLSEEILSYELLDDQEDPVALTDHLVGSTSSLDRVTYDPHSWLSSQNAKRYVQTIYDELIKHFPDHQRSFQRNRVALIDDLNQLEFEYREKFAALDHREFVTSHNAYGYLARDFDLIQFPLQELASTESPSLKTIRTALNFLKTYEIKTIFYEYGDETKSAQSLAEEIGGDYQPLISMEYAAFLDDRADDSYVDLLRYDLEQLYTAMTTEGDVE